MVSETHLPDRASWCILEHHFYSCTNYSLGSSDQFHSYSDTLVPLPGEVVVGLKQLFDTYNVCYNDKLFLSIYLSIQPTGISD